MTTTVTPVLMIGTDSHGKGGVASVIRVLKDEGFLDRESVTYRASHREGGTLTKLLAFFDALIFTLTFCATKRHGIVHVHSASRGSFIRKSTLLWIARIFRCKTVFHLHGAEFQQYGEREAGTILKRWISHTLSKSDCVIALSESWKTYLNKIAPGANVLVVPNSVRVPSVATHQNEQPQRILFLGRAEKRKGIFELVQALAILKAEFPNVVLAVAGDGDLDVLNKYADQCDVASQISILGWINADTRASELDKAAIFALPSFDEGLPMAMLEAMAAGKAVVVTPVGGIPETVKHEANGVLVEPGNVVSLTNALTNLLRRPDYRLELGDRARQTILDSYSANAVLKKFSALYADLRAAE